MDEIVNSAASAAGQPQLEPVHDIPTNLEGIPDAPLISFIVPTLNEERLIVDAILSLRALTAFSHEIIVSDAQSSDSTFELAEEYADKLITTERPRPGVSWTKNTGAQSAEGKYLIFIDADTRIPSINDFISKALLNFHSDPKLVGLAVKKRALQEEESRRSRFFFGLLNSTYAVSNNWLGVGLASGNFQMIRADAFRKLNGYRTDLAAGEDNNMFGRLSRIGRTIYTSSLFTRESTRRAKRLGWFRWWVTLTRNGLSVLLLNKSPHQEYRPIR